MGLLVVSQRKWCPGCSQFALISPLRLAPVSSFHLGSASQHAPVPVPTEAEARQQDDGKQPEQPQQSQQLEEQRPSNTRRVSLQEAAEQLEKHARTPSPETIARARFEEQQQGQSSTSGSAPPPLPPVEDDSKQVSPTESTSSSHKARETRGQLDRSFKFPSSNSPSPPASAKLADQGEEIGGRGVETEEPDQAAADVVAKEQDEPQQGDVIRAQVVDEAEKVSVGQAPAESKGDGVEEADKSKVDAKAKEWMETGKAPELTVTDDDQVADSPSAQPKPRRESEHALLNQVHLDQSTKESLGAILDLANKPTDDDGSLPNHSRAHSDHGESDHAAGASESAGVADKTLHLKDLLRHTIAHNADDPSHPMGDTTPEPEAIKRASEAIASAAAKEIKDHGERHPVLDGLKGTDMGQDKQPILDVLDDLEGEVVKSEQASQPRQEQQEQPQDEEEAQEDDEPEDVSSATTPTPATTSAGAAGGGGKKKKNKKKGKKGGAA